MNVLTAFLQELSLTDADVDPGCDNISGMNFNPRQIPGIVVRHTSRVYQEKMVMVMERVMVKETVVIMKVGMIMVMTPTVIYDTYSDSEDEKEEC